MKSFYVQALLSSMFILLRGWCLFFPSALEQLVFKTDFLVNNATSQYMQLSLSYDSFTC